MQTLVPKPKKMRKRKRSSNTALNVQRISGTDRLTFMSIPANSASGSSFVRIPISPSRMDGTRLQAHSRLWARWRPTMLRIRAVMAGATTTFGAVVASWSPEVDFPVSKPATTMVSRISSLRPTVTLRPWESKILNLPVETTRKWYHTTGISDDSSHGSFVAVVESNLGGYVGSVGLTVHLDWTVEFEGIELEPSGSSDVVDEIVPDSGWRHLFTTSDSSWDAGRLTFKVTSGGSMVPFSSAKENHVYEPKAGTKVPYFKEDGTEASCGFFVPIQGYATPGLGLCASKADAINYIRSGDITKILPYHSPGNWTKPDLPVFVGKPAAAYSSSVERLDLETEVEELRRKISLLQAGNSEWEQLAFPQA